MTTPISAFQVTIKQLANDNLLYVIDVPEINQRLENCIDSYFTKICEGIRSSSDLNSVKDRLIRYLSAKKGSTLEIGSIAEFVIHVYLNESGFNPLFLYFNLEENSIKKGFDGYYFLNNEKWILESKSGLLKGQNISHTDKIKEAYNDLKSKLTGGSTNNPWQNALMHAANYFIGPDEKILNEIKNFTDNYTKKQYHKIEEFNIIPGSTLFLNDAWEDTDATNLQLKIAEAISDFQFKKIKVLCITKKSIDIFMTYLTNRK